jgi:hypothetical protein
VDASSKCALPKARCPMPMSPDSGEVRVKPSRCLGAES